MGWCNITVIQNHRFWVQGLRAWSSYTNSAWECTGAGPVGRYETQILTSGTSNREITRHPTATKKRHCRKWWEIAYIMWNNATVTYGHSQSCPLERFQVLLSLRILLRPFVSKDSSKCGISGGRYLETGFIHSVSQSVNKPGLSSLCEPGHEMEKGNSRCSPVWNVDEHREICRQRRPSTAACLQST